MTASAGVSLDATVLRQISAAAHRVAEQTTERSALDAVVEETRSLIDTASGVTVTLRRPNGRFETLASAGPDAGSADRMQYLARAGPVVQAVEQHDPVVTGDLPADNRWTTLAGRAAELGIRSVLSLNLTADKQTPQHVLTVYSPKAHAFGTTELLIASQLASHCGLAVRGAANAELVANLRRALDSNRAIGVAMGILVARDDVSREQAYDLLRTTSQAAQRKLADIAAEVIETHRLPALPAEWPPRQAPGGSPGTDRAAAPGNVAHPATTHPPG